MSEHSGGNRDEFMEIVKGQFPSTIEQICSAIDDTDVRVRFEAILANPGEDGIRERADFVSLIKERYGLEPNDCGVVFRRLSNHYDANAHRQPKGWLEHDAKLNEERSWSPEVDLEVVSAWTETVKAFLVDVPFIDNRVSEEKWAKVRLDANPFGVDNLPIQSQVGRPFSDEALNNMIVRDLEDPRPEISVGWVWSARLASDTFKVALRTHDPIDPDFMLSRSFYWGSRHGIVSESRVHVSDILSSSSDRQDGGFCNTRKILPKDYLEVESMLGIFAEEISNGTVNFNA